MSLNETSVTYSEKINPVIKAAAAFVPVSDYWQLRLSTAIPTDEVGQITRAVRATNEWARNFGKSEKINQPIKPSLNPIVIASRKFLQRIPLEEYLPARHEVIVEAIASSNKRVAYLEESIGYDAELDKAECEGMALSSELSMTTAAIKAVNQPPA
ncbi:MAG: hypothetical protein AAB430_02515 [Patescibacteria group bacterium]